MNDKHSSEISIICGYIEQVYPTYGTIVSQNEKVYFDLHSVTLGHGKEIIDLRSFLSTGSNVQAAVIKNLQLPGPTNAHLAYFAKVQWIALTGMSLIFVAAICFNDTKMFRLKRFFDGTY